MELEVVSRKCSDGTHGAGAIAGEDRREGASAGVGAGGGKSARGDREMAAAPDDSDEAPAMACDDEAGAIGRGRRKDAELTGGEWLAG